MHALPGEQQLLGALHTPNPLHPTPTPTGALLAAPALSGNFKQEMGRFQGFSARVPPVAWHLHRMSACVLQGLHQKLCSLPILPASRFSTAVTNSWQSRRE